LILLSRGVDNNSQLRENLLEAARRREIDAVLVRRLDRWGRSVTDLLATLQELEHHPGKFRATVLSQRVSAPATVDRYSCGGYC
jgi:DNA invertase Pin-like site-specific DNA recombinase